jgi:hypothetical protein
MGRMKTPKTQGPPLPAHTLQLSSKFKVRSCRICRGSCSCDLQNLLVPSASLGPGSFLSIAGGNMMSSSQGSARQYQ